MSGQRLDGPGTDTLGVGDEDGYVVLRFKEPVLWVKLDPATALSVGQAIAGKSYRAKFGDDPTPQRTALTDQLRVTLVRRIELMLGSFEREAPRPDLKIQAARVVDTCLSEVA